MKTKTMSKWASVMLIMLGCVHDAATFTPLISGGLETLATGKAHAVIYMSLICGTSLVLCGALLLLLFDEMGRSRMARRACLAVSAFLALAGVLAVVLMAHNPFAWATLVVAMAQSSLVICAKKISPELRS